MPVLVTGASGFLGGRLARLLVEAGEEVVVLRRPASRTEHLQGLPVRAVIGDLSDAASLGEAVRGMERIFHCAACSTDWASDRTYLSANVAGTVNLLAAAETSAVLQRFVHVSTTDVYGYPAVPCDESGATRDAGLPYNRTKLLGEEAVWRASRERGMPVTILRPATIYGPRGKDFTAEIAALLRQRLMATIDGGQARGGWTYVDNVAQAMMTASTHPSAAGEAFNVCDGTGATWAEYLARFGRALGARPPWIDLSRPTAERLARGLEAVHRTLRLPGRPLLTRHATLLLAVDQEFPAAKAGRLLQWSPHIGLDEGIDRSAAWIRGTWAKSGRSFSDA